MKKNINRLYIEKNFKNRRGSISIIAMYILVLILTSSTVILLFASSQAALSRNQLEKIQYRYIIEDDLNKIIYDDSVIDKHITEKIFKTFRSGRKPEYGEYPIKLVKDDKLSETIENAIFKLENIDGRTNIILEIYSKFNNIKGKIIAYGSCIADIFELNKSILIEDKLTTSEKDLFLEFINQMEKENWDYDCKLNINSKKVNSNDNILLGLTQETSKEEKFFSEKQFINTDKINKNITNFTKEAIIFNLKREDDEKKSLTIGNITDTGLIKVNGVLYIEGDLIINQDFEFLGLIIINEGNIIINTLNKPKIEGMIFYIGDNYDFEDLDVNYNQDIIYKAASFLPGFIDIEIDTIKKY